MRHASCVVEEWPEGQTNVTNRMLVVDEDTGIRQLGTEVLIRHGDQVDAADRGDLLITGNTRSKLKSQRNTRLLAALHCLVLGPLLGLAFCCQGMDWPQYRGPNHDGISTDHINQQWSGSVTTAVWRVTLGQAFSSFVVAQGKAVTQVYSNSNTKETCIALNITNGNQIWSRTLETGLNYGGYNGPRSTPTIEQDSVYTLTSNLKLFRLNLADGAVVWSNNLVATLGASVIDGIGWASAASPLLDGGLIYVNLNTGAGALAAFWATNGALAWRVENERMTHSTPVAATIHGTRQVIFATQNGLVSVNSTNGQKLWSYPYPNGFNGTCLGGSPVVCSNIVFISQSYSPNSTAARIDLAGGVWSANHLWDRPIGMIWMTPVAFQGAIYGPIGDSSSATSPLVCLDLLTGDELWSCNGFGRGSVALAGNLILGLTEAGRLCLIRPDTNAYTELAAFRALNAGDCWNSFAISDGKIYARSTLQGACFDLSVPDSPPAIAVGPASLNLGSLQAGTCASGTFYVTNLGGGTLTGSVSGAAAPFSPVSGGSYTLTATQWQVVVVQYCPTVPGSNNVNLTFTGGSGATRPVTGSAYPKPSLTLDPPWPSPGNQFELTIRTANGTPMDSNRLAGMEVRASTNLALPASAWPKLTNNLLLTNGVARVLNVEGGPPRQYFIVREPQ